LTVLGQLPAGLVNATTHPRTAPRQSCRREGRSETRWGRGRSGRSETWPSLDWCERLIGALDRDAQS